MFGSSNPKKHGLLGHAFSNVVPDSEHCIYLIFADGRMNRRIHTTG